MPRALSPSPKSYRSHVALPGILRQTIERRWEEFGYPSFPPFALELICFDMRKRREHLITRVFADDTPAAQDALDRELVRQYQPGQKARGPLIQAIFCEVGETERSLPRGDFAVFRSFVRYSEILRPCIEKRWHELGYRSFSAYVTSLIRYDLLLLGPHKYFNGDDTAPDLLAALDTETAQIFNANKPQRLYLDQLIEKAAGRKLTDEERAGIMRRIAAMLREKAMKPRRPAAEGS